MQATTLKTDSRAPVGSLHSLTEQNLRCFVVWMLTVAVVFTGVVTLLLWIIGGISVSGGSGVCVTPACAELAASFEGILNYSVNPCNDMHAFVCSKVVRRSSGRGSLSLVADVIKQYELQMVKLFTDGQTTFTASAMVADFFRACTGAYETPPSVDSFMNFFDFVTVPWPFSDTYDNDQHPLQAVLTLTLNWGITTWFRAYVDVSRRRTAAPDSSAEPAGAAASFWLDFVRVVEAVNGREKYHALFLARYNVSLPEHGSVAKRLAVEKDVLSTLDEARSPRAGLLPLVATIAKVAAAAANSDVEYWLDAVSNAPGMFDVDETMRVVVRDVRIIRAVGRLLAAYSEDDLMQHLSWWLVQMLTVIGWPQAYVVIAGSQEVARSEVKVECYRMIADRFALLLASESSMKLFTHDARVEVEAFFAGMVDFMEDVGSRVPWLSDKDKATLAKKVDDLEVVVWPPDVDASNETLWLLYENFCASCDRGNKSGAVPSVTTAAPHVGLIDFWWHANVQFLQLSAEQNERMQLRWLWDSLEVLTYDPWYNRLRVSHAALRNPLYRPNSPELRKANYGALGTSFFLSMLQMFEEPATDFKSDVAVPAWAELGNFSRLVDELNCSAEFLPNVREIVALGLAWHALNVSTELPAEYLRRHRVTAHTRLAIRDERGDEHLYNTDQLFFLSYCRSRCTRYHSADHSHDLNCNAAVSSIAEFRQAFKCDLGSPMAPQETCQLSDFF
ncbi:hypothetical protein HPB50_016105 [Hyalomma asiaticum]|uniref:Uncharacterized protein n=1 Tax=Hyalomma asiaticum TaxID=266040 RepID=A0ACB7SW84_HYAAI|nr:hypothetical protein HPB50_016105 [Hyalomma asiaticum]